MKKKKEIEIPKDKYIYQRYNGIITKYIVDKEYYIAIGTGITTKKNETVLLGKVAENIIDLIEVGDIVEYQVNSLSESKVGRVKSYRDARSNKEYLGVEGFDITKIYIKSILTNKQFEENCYKAKGE